MPLWSETSGDVVRKQREAAAPKVKSFWKSHRNPGFAVKDFFWSWLWRTKQHRTGHTMMNTFIPTKGWPNYTMNTCLTSLGCLPACWRGKTPTTHYSDAVEAITMPVPMCDIRDMSGLLICPCALHYPGHGKGDLYSPLCLSWLACISLSERVLR